MFSILRLEEDSKNERSPFLGGALGLYLRSCLCPWPAGPWLDTCGSADDSGFHLHTQTQNFIEMKRTELVSRRIAVSQSKKQEMVGLLTPNVVVTDLSSCLSSILLCGEEGRRRRWGSNAQTPGHAAPTDPHQRALQSKDGRRAGLLQWLHAAPPPAPPEAVRLPWLQVELPAKQRRVFPALLLHLVWTLLRKDKKKQPHKQSEDRDWELFNPCRRALALSSSLFSFV